MKIDSGTVGMESARNYRARGKSVRYEGIKEYRQGFAGGMFGDAMSGSLTSGGWQAFPKGDAGEGTLAFGSAGEGIPTSGDIGVTIRDARATGQARAKVSGGYGLYRSGRVRTSVTQTDRNSKNVAEDLRQITMRYIFELLFATRRGMRNRWLEQHGLTQGTEQLSESEEEIARNLTDADMGGGLKTSGNGMQVRKMIQVGSYAEEENTSFAAKGIVRTADGREIDFKIDLSMSRRFETSFAREIQQVKKAMKDPLVINFDAPAAAVKEQKFFFDLDADGNAEEISQLGSGSGFLALDLNEDGRINDGSELFGTASGDGFKDLAKYDQDGNGWIDENDEVWQKLKIWAKDETGKDILYRLADLNVGAIYLGSVGTEYSLLGQAGNTEGIIRKTGLFLYENGLAGTMQHLDLAT